MTDPPRPLAEHQLTVIRACLRQMVPVSERIDRFYVEATAHRSTLEPGRRPTLPVRRAMLEDPRLARCAASAWSRPCGPARAR
jgi:hypothetical protein